MKIEFSKGGDFLCSCEKKEKLMVVEITGSR